MCSNFFRQLQILLFFHRKKLFYFPFELVEFLELSIRLPCCVSGTLDHPSCMGQHLRRRMSTHHSPYFRKGGYPLYIYRQCNYFENQYYEKKNLEGSPILIDPHLGSLNHFHSFIHFITYSFIFQRPTTYWQVLGFRLCVLFHATKLKLGLKSNLYFPDSFSLFYFKTVIWNPISLTS